VALENGVKTVAFPAISCGVYGYPHKEAAAIAVDTVTTFVQENSGLALVRFVLFNGELFSIFEQALDIVA